MQPLPAPAVVLERVGQLRTAHVENRNDQLPGLPLAGKGGGGRSGRWSGTALTSVRRHLCDRGRALPLQVDISAADNDPRRRGQSGRDNYRKQPVLEGAGHQAWNSTSVS